MKVKCRKNTFEIGSYYEELFLQWFRKTARDLHKPSAFQCLMEIDDTSTSASFSILVATTHHRRLWVLNATFRTAKTSPRLINIHILLPFFLLERIGTRLGDPSTSRLRSIKARADGASARRSCQTVFPLVKIRQFFADFSEKSSKESDERTIFYG